MSRSPLTGVLTGVSGAPPAGDVGANAVITGTITALGPTDPFPFFGNLNVSIWGSANPHLTATAGSTAATVNSGTGLVAGQSINSTLVPAGTTASVVSGTNVTLAIPPNRTLATDVLAGTDNGALFAPATWDATINLERSLDGGATWLICGVGGSGTGATYVGTTQAGTPVSIVAGEPERGTLYRLNCTVYASGTINYRLSASGQMAMSAGVSS